MVNHYGLMEEVLSEPEKIGQYVEHPDWRVRYAAAVAIGRTGDEKWIDTLLAMLKYEDTRNLYTQPRVLGFENSYDDTRMAEQLVPIKEIFDQDYPEELKEDWRCRDRVKQACLFAVRDIGKVSGELLAYLHTTLQRQGEDYAVCAAAARALGYVGHKGSIPYLEKALGIDEWCVQTEAKKAIRRLQGEEGKGA